MLHLVSNHNTYNKISFSFLKVFVIATQLITMINIQDLSLTGDVFSEDMHDNVSDLMIDSVISQSHRVEERYLEPWMDGDDDPMCPELDNIFDGKWNRLIFSITIFFFLTSIIMVG